MSAGSVVMVPRSASGRAGLPVVGAHRLRHMAARRLRTTTRTPRSDGAVGHRRDHDPEAGPHNVRRATPSDEDDPAP
jgi:hypothetical protein